LFGGAFADANGSGVESIGGTDAGGEAVTWADCGCIISSNDPSATKSATTGAIDLMVWTGDCEATDPKWRLQDMTAMTNAETTSIHAQGFGGTVYSTAYCAITIAGDWEQWDAAEARCSDNHPTGAYDIVVLVGANWQTVPGGGHSTTVGVGLLSTECGLATMSWNADKFQSSIWFTYTSFACAHAEVDFTAKSGTETAAGGVVQSTNVPWTGKLKAYDLAANPTLKESYVLR
jgi:hypothetical protein